MRYKFILGRRRRRSSHGQGITEYGAIIAFVSVVVALVFSFSHGSLLSALSGAFSAIVSQLNNLSQRSADASS